MTDAAAIRWSAAMERIGRNFLLIPPSGRRGGPLATILSSVWLPFGLLPLVP